MMDFHFNGQLGTDGSSRKFIKSAAASDQQSEGAPASPGHDDDDNRNS